MTFNYAAPSRGGLDKQLDSRPRGCSRAHGNTVSECFLPQKGLSHQGIKQYRQW